MRSYEVQTIVNKSEKWAFEVCHQRVNMMSHMIVYLNLPKDKKLFTSDIKFAKTVSHIAFESQTRLFDVFVHVSHNISIPHAEKAKLTNDTTFNLSAANDEKVTIL